MATEIEVIKFEGDLSALRKDLKAAESSFSTLENKGKVAAKNTEQSFSKLGSSVKNVLQNLPFGGLINDLQTASQSARGLGQGIAEIGGGASKAGGGVRALTSLIGVGLLGAVALAVAAFASIVAFFKQTDEGAAKLDATFAGLGGATDFLTGKLSQMGSKLVDSFKEGGVGAKILDASLLTLRATAGVLTFGFSEVAISLVGNSGIVNGMKEAAKRAYDLSIALDSIQDEMRLLGVESKATELQIQALLKQAKNRGIDVTTRLGLITQAQELENSNLQKNFELQRRYYDNIAQTNLLKLASINSENRAGLQRVKAVTDQIKLATSADQLLSLYRQQIEAQKGLASISDDQAQSQVDGLQKIIELDGRSQVLQEKYASITSQLIEKEIADRTEAIKAVERAREASAITTIKGEQELSRSVLAIKIASLQSQKALLKQYGKDTSAIDLEIATLNKKYLDDLTKAQDEANAKRLASDKARSDAERKLMEENYTKSIGDIDERTKFQLLNIRETAKTNEEAKRQELALEIGALEAKKIINQEAGKSTLDIELELQSKKKELYNQDVEDYNQSQAKKKQATINTLGFIFDQTESIYNGLAQNRAARTQVEISESQMATQKKEKDLQKQLENGTISQEKYSATLRLIQEKQARTEAALKAKQAKADKQAALFNIIINTAASIAKTLATLGVPAGIPASLIAAAAGAAQYAIVNARPVPKYKDGVIDLQGKGTGKSDSIDAKLSKGESVMTAKETNDNLGLLWAIRNNKLDEYADRAWVKPALDKQDEIKKNKEQRYNRMMKKAIGKNQELDTFELEKAIRKNGSVKITNWDEMPIGKGRNIV